MDIKVPNLESLLERSRQMLLGDQEFLEALEKVKERKKDPSLQMNLLIECFPQWWDRGSTPFDPPDKKVRRSKILRAEYTSIVHELTTDTFLVYFGDEFGYKVHPAGLDFYDDMRTHSMAKVSKAAEVY